MSKDYKKAIRNLEALLTDDSHLSVEDLRKELADDGVNGPHRASPAIALISAWPISAYMWAIDSTMTMTKTSAYELMTNFITSHLQRAA